MELQQIKRDTAPVYPMSALSDNQAQAEVTESEKNTEQKAREGFVQRIEAFCDCV